MAGRPPEVPDDELLQAIKEQCEAHGTPVVTTTQAHESERITITQRKMRERLTTLHKEEERVGMIEVGGHGKIWWVPEEEDVEVDYSGLAWENIDPEGIPKEKLEAHPDVDIPNRIDRIQRRAESTFDIAGFSLFLGFVAFISTRYFDIPYIVESTEEGINILGAVGIVFGFFLLVIVVFFIVIGVSARILAKRGANEAAKAMQERFTQWVVEKTGYRLVKAKDDTPDDSTE